MNRDVDLTRQLLFDIERRGADCPLDVLCADQRHDTSERVRYHLRLLVDAGWIKEVDRTAAGSPCVRLAHAGQEFVELARSDGRWRAAKAVVMEQTGGLALGVLRALLGNWAWRAVLGGEPRRRQRRRYGRYAERLSPELWLDAFDGDPRALWDDDHIRMVRRQPEIREQLADGNGWNADLYGDLAAELADQTAGGSLPDQFI